MSFDKSKFKIFGNITTKQLYIVSQEESFELGEYFILENKNESTPLEVIEAFEVPMCISGMLPIDVPNEYLKFLELDILKSANFARVKILNHIQKPIHSGEVRRASFEELEKLLINHDNINESFVLGTIQGTSSVYDLMPEKYKGIAPIFNGKEMVKQDGVPFLVNPSKQMEYPHSGYFGGSGSGKSYALKVSCEELMKRRIPAILLDPHHEMEFKDNLSEKGIDYKNRNEVFVIGTDIGIKFTKLTSSELIRLCDFSDPLSEPQKATFEAIYEKGMTASTLTSRINSLREIVEMHENSTINQFDDYKKDLDVETILLYEKVKQKVSSSKAIQALSWKINKLLNSSIFSDSGTKKIESCILQSKLAIIRGDIKRMQMISSYVINKLYQKRRMYQDSITKNQGENIPYFPMFYIIMDEAHNFAPNNNDAGMNPTKQILKTVAQEARKY
ncbi:MAG: ATP-binding protein, partial [Romboutsia sp.]|nr:ATP-binding protein [Romboutsia sp.]